MGDGCIFCWFEGCNDPDCGKETTQVVRQEAWRRDLAREDYLRRQLIEDAKKNDMHLGNRPTEGEEQKGENLKEKPKTTQD